MSNNSTGPHRPPSSSTTALRPNNADDVTWLDFLRTAGGTVAADDHDRSSSAERKRRRTGTEPERRSNPHPPTMSARRPSGISAGSGSGPGSSLSNAIDLTTPSRQTTSRLLQQRSSEGHGSVSRAGEMRGLIGQMRANFAAEGQRRSSEALPKWQPDSEVTACPVCTAEFSFWFRKHHCRKCGRVVCSNCSPHRITIPRQYIVQPPTAEPEPSQASPTAASPTGRNLGGGEVVRVCNPCVPDPWTPNTAPEPPERLPNEPVPVRRRESREDGHRPERYRPIPPPPSQRHHDSLSRARSQSHQPQAPNFSRSVPQHSDRTPLPTFALQNPHSRQPPHLPPPSSSSRHGNHRHTQSAHSSNAPLSPVPPFAVSGRPPIPVSSASSQARPRREVREEDECPVCGIELPSGENVRETHIQECIASRFSSTPSSNAPPFSPPLPTFGAPTPLGSQTAGSRRPRASSSYHRPRGMALYRATEKDCMTEDETPQECVICFEEFQPGDEMGRMECLCKFHRVCIRQWWDTKGTGSCPTHMLHE